jgi:hypothetical protein
MMNAKDHMHTASEMEHATRARSLKQAFGQVDTVLVSPSEATIEKLAEFLHQQYRATAKAMSKLHHPLTPNHRPILHDHGWGDCYGKKKAYFLRRAAWLMTDFPAYNGRLGKGGK